ncbi:MAG: hypothetical protein JEZ04_11340 [Spirochaetales bacterium]|nr:hypothetical protein [Spirochaetales bacterium]
MRRLLFTLLLISVITLGAFAEVTINLQPTAIPVNPNLAGQGGSFTANAKGYNSLFKNPAGFAMDGGSFTLLSINSWVFADQSLIDFATNPEGVEGYYQDIGTQLAEVDQADIEAWVDTTSEAEMLEMLETAGFDPAAFETNPQGYIESLGLESIASDPQTALSDGTISVEMINLATAVIEDIAGVELLPSGNLRIGTNIGLLGGVGGGFGFGINLNADAYLKGPTIISAEGYAALTATVTAGYALELLPDFLYIGADLRPLYRVYLPVSGEQALSLMTDFSDITATMNAYSAYAGWGLGIDAGAIIKLGDLKLGLTVTDILDTKMNYTAMSVGELLASAAAMSIPAGTEIANEMFVIPMDVLLGAAYTLNFADDIYLDIHAEVSNVVRGFRALQDGDDYDYLSLLHAGAEFSLWNFIGLRGGYNEGYLSAGASIKLFFIEVAASGFMKANTASVGYSDFGASVEAAIRF